MAKQMETDRKAREAPQLRNLHVALGEYDTGWHGPAKSLIAAAKIVRAAKAAGADLVVLPEACTTGFTSDASRVEPLDGPRVKALGEIADKTRTHVAAGVVAFRAVAKHVDAMIVLANWPAAELAEWDALLRARAIENRCYVIGVNRTGRGGGLEYGGGSNAFDPYGDQPFSLRVVSRWWRCGKIR